MLPAGLCQLLPQGSSPASLLCAGSSARSSIAVEVPVVALAVQGMGSLQEYVNRGRLAIARCLWLATSFCRGGP